MIGKTLAHYEINGLLGKGGMGVVYSATDTKLRRDVAIKVLPDDFAQDQERLARFEREAHILASLNHTGIASIYGLEESGGIRFLVMELVPGETLADRLAKGTLPVDEALRVARQIAEALEEAHEHAIIHRDLKPANIKVTSDGKVKVLDFGLAKAVSSDGSGQDLSHSPTATFDETRAGVILGTAPYMSPEQARGKPVDKRTDIFAFGSVIYEMLAGQRAFGGDTVSDTMAAILEREPEWERLPPATPTKVSDLLRRCLKKDPHQRLHDIADARIEIDDALVGGTDTAVPPVVASTGRSSRWLPWIIAATAVAVASFALKRGGGEEQSVQTQSLAMTIRLEDEQNMADDGFAALTPSPDGQYLLWTSRKGLYLRQRSSLEHSFVPTPTQISSVGFSPDSRWVAYSHSGKLFRQSVTGGAAIEICEVRAGRGLSWVDEQTIVMSIDYASSLHLISVADGSVRELTKLRAEERSHRWPFVVPGGDEVLFMTQLPGRDYQDSDIEAVSLTDGSRRTIYRGGAFPRYSPSGHLLFARNDVLLAIPYQPGSDSAHGIATPILQGILTFVGDQELDDGSVQYGFDAQGTLVYRTALSRTAVESKMAWLDLETGEIETFGESGHFSDPIVSPNGQHLAVRRGLGSESQVIVRDLATGSERAITSDRGTKYMGAWDEASEFVYWTQANANASMFETRRAPRDGRLSPESIFEYPQSIFVERVTHDGRWLYFTYWTPEESYNTGRIELGIDEPTLELVLGGIGDQVYIRFSPNGRFFVYSDGPTTSTSEWYVRRVPDTGASWLVGSGRKDRREMYWSTDGSAIYELDSESVQAHPVTISGDAVSFGQPRFLHPTTWLMRKDTWDTDLHPDGDRLVVLISEHPTNEDAGSRIVWQTEWFDELRRMTGSD